jgi:hypothetical protein
MNSPLSHWGIYPVDTPINGLPPERIL